MKKILVIGQAPPAVKQTYPYDTTYFYEWLSWCNVTKLEAQDRFDFDAMTDKFPGHGANGHLLPSESEMLNYFNTVLKQKIENVDKVLILGKVAEYNLSKFLNGLDKNKFCCLMHPSRRNTGMIIANKAKIIDSINKLLN